jgi:hypothetical protein
MAPTEEAEVWVFRKEKGNFAKVDVFPLKTVKCHPQLISR